jgi:hypothetical protein
MKSIEAKTTTTIAVFLILTFAATIVALPIANANYPALSVPTYAYLHIAPNPVGVDQTVTLIYWLNWIPPGAAGLAGERWTGWTIEVTKPDETNETLVLWASDPVGGGYTSYTPDQVGTYTFKFIFPGQEITGSTGTGIYNYNIAINDTYLASNATATLTVQQEPIPQPPTYPLPTEYWTRPIEGQNEDWWTISSNWLRGSQIVGGIVQLDGTAPNSAHVMWTKPLQDGGVVGGSRTGIEGITYYDGSAYEGKGRNSLIMYGRFYYGLPLSGSPSGGGYACVNLYTGEEIFWQNMNLPSFGQLFDYESINQHGVIPNGYLWATAGGGFFFGPAGPTTWLAYDPLTGNWLFNETDVPSGTEVYGTNGEIVHYVLNDQGKWLALWNNTQHNVGLEAAVGGTGTTTNDYQWRPIGKSVNMSNAYSWNVTAPWLPTGATIVSVIADDVLLGRNGSLPAIGTSWAPYTMWAMSLKPDSKGQLLWMKNYDAPAGNLSRSIRQVDPENHVFITYDQQVMQYSGYSIDNGSLLWGPTPSEAPLNFYALTTGFMGAGASAVAYGKLYSTGYSGIVYCYDTKTGSLLWNYSASGGLATPYGAYSLLIGAIADGKVYLSSYEHSANAPHWKGSKMHCVNASTGEKIWTVDGWFADYSTCVADGYLVALNDYDMQLYCFGKGPSATTVEAPMTAITAGNSVVIQGTVTDIAAGTKQLAQEARFPNGVPAVSDANMDAWMAYVYMQKPRPTDATGVEVSLDAVDPNGNLIHIGTATSDTSGTFSYTWTTPDVPGDYAITATFEGSESYWGSYAETHATVTQAPAATAQPEYPQPIDNTWTIVGVGIVLLIAIVLVGVWIKRK